jgi:hypothetical protein
MWLWVTRSQKGWATLNPVALEVCEAGRIESQKS